MSKRGRIVFGAVVAALVIVGAGAAMPVRDAALTARACQAITDYLDSEGAIQTVGAGDQTVTVLGDSYTSGDELEDRADRWPNRLAVNARATVILDGIGNTGFTNGGFCGDQQFGSRIDAIRDTSPELLIIQGGMNDWEEGPEAITAAATALLKDVANVPTVVLVGPTNSPTRPGVKEVDAALADAADAAGRQYISALNWTVDFADDGVHMTPGDHVHYADQLAKELAL